MSDVPMLSSIREAASEEAKLSRLPGFNDGPADAYRHAIGVGEMRRRFGYGIAFLAMNLNEFAGRLRGHSEEGTRMDNHNNAWAWEAGGRARTYEEMVRLARQGIEEAIERRGSGDGSTLMWLPPSRWGGDRGRSVDQTLTSPWPSSGPSAHDYRYGHERYRFELAFGRGSVRERQAALMARLADAPPAEWAEMELRAAMNLPAYLNPAHPEHATWRARVRAHFEAKIAAEGAANDAGCGGVAAVRAHTRRGPGGPVAVAAHQRAVPCP